MKPVVLFLTAGDLSKPSAANNRLLAIARGLIENDAQVIWLGLTDVVPESFSNNPHYRNIRFIELISQSSRGYFGKLVNYLKRSLAVSKIPVVLDSLHPDCRPNACFTVGDDFYILSRCLRILHARGVRVFHERTEYPYLAFDRSLFRKIRLFLYYQCFISKVDHIFVITTALREHFVGYLNQRKLRTPVSVLNMLVEPDMYFLDHTVPIDEMTLTANSRDVTYVGTMYGDKDGVDVLIAAFLEIQQDYPDTKLILVGDNKQKNRMIKTLQVLSRATDASRILFTGRVNQEGVRRCLHSAYCLALARPGNIQAKYGFPTKLGEYLASGKPVVVTKTGDIPLFLTDGVNSYLAEPDDVDSFAQKLRECLDDPKRALTIGAEGRKLVDTVFNYKECVKTVLDACN